MQDNQSPLSGAYIGSDGSVKNFDGGTGGNRSNMKPLSGNFIGSDGEIHNLDELFNGGGGGISDVLVDEESVVEGGVARIDLTGKLDKDADIDMAGHTIANANANTPTQNNNIATKKYVDDHSGGSEPPRRVGFDIDEISFKDSGGTSAYHLSSGVTVVTICLQVLKSMSKGQCIGLVDVLAGSQFVPAYAVFSSVPDNATPTSTEFPVAVDSEGTVTVVTVPPTGANRYIYGQLTLVEEEAESDGEG
jgi:hypothetical protein